MRSVCKRKYRLLDCQGSLKAMYPIIQIGPRFLSYVSEEGKVIGSIMDKVEDARHATIGSHIVREDLD